jgi:hypothetical protein
LQSRRSSLASAVDSVLDTSDNISHTRPISKTHNKSGGDYPTSCAIPALVPTNY